MEGMGLPMGISAMMEERGSSIGGDTEGGGRAGIGGRGGGVAKSRCLTVAWTSSSLFT